jgi:hypothetical protein
LAKTIFSVRPNGSRGCGFHNDFALGQSDVNASTTRHPSLVFNVFDNLVVTPVPEPGTRALTGLAVPAFLLLRRRRAVA